MKTAEEWISLCEFDEDDKNSHAILSINQIEQIQLDAFKDGMTHAAEQVKWNNGAKLEILTNRDNLKELP